MAWIEAKRWNEVILWYGVYSSVYMWSAPHCKKVKEYLRYFPLTQTRISSTKSLHFQHTLFTYTLRGSHYPSPGLSLHGRVACKPAPELYRTLDINSGGSGGTGMRGGSPPVHLPLGGSRFSSSRRVVSPSLQQEQWILRERPACHCDFSTELIIKLR